jgi:hypothetical protein
VSLIFKLRTNACSISSTELKNVPSGSPRIHVKLWRNKLEYLKEQT